MELDNLAGKGCRVTPSEERKRCHPPCEMTAIIRPELSSRPEDSHLRALPEIVPQGVV